MAELARLLAGIGRGLDQSLPRLRELYKTAGQPAVVATHNPSGLPSHAPHVLFCGHHDARPADPFDLWKSPPFEPQFGKGKYGQKAIYARGASGDKGQLLTFFEASRAWPPDRANGPGKSFGPESDRQGIRSWDHIVAEFT